MRKANNNTTNLEKQGASLLDIKLPQKIRLKLLIYEGGKDNASKLKQLAQDVADSHNEPVTLISLNVTAKQKFQITETVTPNSQIQLQKPGYGVDNIPDVLEQVWGVLKAGVVIIRPSLSVVFINETAKQIMQHNNMLNFSAKGWYLISGHRKAQDICRCTRTRQPGGFELMHDKTKWQAKVIPVSDTYVAIFMSCSTLSDQDCQLIRRRYNLTDGEVKFVTQFTKNPGIQDVADNLHISVATARTVLRNIYYKTGVNSQQELMQLVMTSATMAISDPDDNK